MDHLRRPTLSPGLHKQLNKLSYRQRLNLSLLYHFVFMLQNKYGPAGCLRRSKIDTWKGLHPQIGEIEWKIRKPYLSDEQQLQIMEYLYNRQQAAAHYRASLIDDRPTDGRQTSLV